MMTGVEMHYPIGGLIVLIGSIAALKYLDYLAAQTVRRMREMTKCGPVTCAGDAIGHDPTI